MGKLGVVGYGLTGKGGRQGNLLHNQRINFLWNKSGIERIVSGGLSLTFIRS
jgi:hypothetical protein